MAGSKDSLKDRLSRYRQIKLSVRRVRVTASSRRTVHQPERCECTSRDFQRTVVE